VISQNKDTNYRYEVRLTLQNAGSTPAYKVANNVYADTLPTSLPADFKIPEFNPSISGESTLGPHQTMILTAVAPRIYSDDEVNEIEHGTKASLFVFGTITYEDAFGASRYTKICQVILWLKNGSQMSRNYGTYNQSNRIRCPAKRLTSRWRRMVDNPPSERSAWPRCRRCCMTMPSAASTQPRTWLQRRKRCYRKPSCCGRCSSSAISRLIHRPGLASKFDRAYLFAMVLLRELRAVLPALSNLACVALRGETIARCRRKEITGRLWPGRSSCSLQWKCAFTSLKVRSDS